VSNNTHNSNLKQWCDEQIRSTSRSVPVPLRRLNTRILTHSASQVPLNTAADPNETTCAAHERVSERAKQGTYCEYAAAIVGLLQL